MKAMTLIIVLVVVITGICFRMTQVSTREPVAEVLTAAGRAMASKVGLTGGELEPFYKTPKERWSKAYGSIAWQNGWMGAMPIPELLKRFMETGDPSDLPTAEELAQTMTPNANGEIRVADAEYIIHILVRPKDPCVKQWVYVKETK